jgi:selenocysteine lyase/cysteine desulfurase
VHAHNVRLAGRFMAGLGLPPPAGAIVSVAQPGAAERLAGAGVRASVRAGRARLSFHLYTTEADVDQALEALSS